MLDKLLHCQSRPNVLALTVSLSCYTTWEYGKHLVVLDGELRARLKQQRGCLQVSPVQRSMQGRPAGTGRCLLCCQLDMQVLLAARPGWPAKGQQLMLQSSLPGSLQKLHACQSQCVRGSPHQPDSASWMSGDAFASKRRSMIGSAFLHTCETSTGQQCKRLSSTVLATSMCLLCVKCTPKWSDKALELKMSQGQLSRSILYSRM